MSFFENKRILGFVLWLVAIITIAQGVACIIAGAMGNSNSFIPEDMDNKVFYGALTGIGSILVGFLYLGFSALISRRILKEKIDIIAGLVRMLGVTTILGGLFDAAASIIGTGDVGAGFVAAVISALIGLVIIFIASRINDRKVDVFDKIIWIVLVVLIAIVTVLVFIGLIGMTLSVDLGLVIIIIGVVAEIIINLFVLVYLFDADVMRKMGMKS